MKSASGDHSRYRLLLGFDYGTRKIGVAVGQQQTGTATALVTLPCRANRPDWAAIERLIAEWEPDALLVGVPVHMDGTEHELTERARRFGRQLAARFALPVLHADERLTSVEAARTAGPNGRTPRADDVDQHAARLIVQAWLDAHTRPPPGA